MAEAPLEYIPKPIQQQQQAPQFSYELTQDGTGKAPEKIGPVTITDKKGQKINLPYPPKSNCKKCFGKGYLGYLIAKGTERDGRLIVCAKCYPMIRGR